MDSLVTDLFCRSGVPKELQGHQGRNVELRLMQEVLQRLEEAVRWHDATICKDS